MSYLFILKYNKILKSTCFCSLISNIQILRLFKRNSILYYDIWIFSFNKPLTSFKFYFSFSSTSLYCFYINLTLYAFINIYQNLISMYFLLILDMNSTLIYCWKFSRKLKPEKTICLILNVKSFLVFCIR